MAEMMVSPDKGETELGSPLLVSQPCDAPGRSATRQRAPILGREEETHETFMNGVTTDVDSIGIFGFMMLAEPSAVQMAKNDYVFVTAEPYNAAPVELLTAYSWDSSIGRTKVELAAYDWGIPDPQQRWRRLMADLFAPEGQQFVRQYRHDLPVEIPGAAPGGVYGFWFKNYYVAGVGNMVFFRDPTNGNWMPIYEREGADPPLPTPAGARSGWSVLEYKRSYEYQYTAPWTSIRTPIGIANIHLLPRSGENWFRPSGAQTGWQFNLNKYKRVWEEPIFSFAYRDWS